MENARVQCRSLRDKEFWQIMSFISQRLKRLIHALLEGNAISFFIEKFLRGTEIHRINLQSHYEKVMIFKKT